MITPELITQVGFPMAVVIYLLWERQSTMKELIKVIGHLETAIIKLEGKLGK